MPQSSAMNSMTAFAAARGASPGHVWTWELRSVNGKGLDLRLRVPEWISGLEAALRARLTTALARGNVSLTLRVQTDGAGGRMVLNDAQLDAALDALAEIETRALARGLSLAPARPGDILILRGVFEPISEETQDNRALKTALLHDFEPLLADFSSMRAREGTALHAVISAQLDEIGRLIAEAASAAEARGPEQAEALNASLARVLQGADGIDPDRVAQELALLAIKADVTEEIDRLSAHVGAARALLASAAPVGRKLDFLMQEFNREANTLCAKAQSNALTTIGLALKAVIDQLREQVQNVE